MNEEKIIKILDELKKINPYPEKLFPQITKKDFTKIDNLLSKKMGFRIDKLSGNLGRKIYKSIIEDVKDKFTEEIEEEELLKAKKIACREMEHIEKILKKGGTKP
jgi:hypothetical protein